MNRGAQPIMPRRKPAGPRVPVTIRIPEEVVQEIDLDLERRAVPVSRNNWLLEAAIEKLRRTAAGDSNGSQ
jgi:hypothetical protein